MSSSHEMCRSPIGAQNGTEPLLLSREAVCVWSQMCGQVFRGVKAGAQGRCPGQVSQGRFPGKVSRAGAPDRCPGLVPRAGARGRCPGKVFRACAQGRCPRQEYRQVSEQVLGQLPKPMQVSRYPNKCPKQVPQTGVQSRCPKQKNVPSTCLAQDAFPRRFWKFLYLKTPPRPGGSILAPTFHNVYEKKFFCFFSTKKHKKHKKKKAKTK